MIKREIALFEKVTNQINHKSRPAKQNIYSVTMTVSNGVIHGYTVQWLPCLVIFLQNFSWGACKGPTGHDFLLSSSSCRNLCVILYCRRREEVCWLGDWYLLLIWKRKCQVLCHHWISVFSTCFLGLSLLKNFQKGSLFKFKGRIIVSIKNGILASFISSLFVLVDYSLFWKCWL